ncbi:hypothetical protein SHELI_v1c01420 [Spiroplasma helicoides]|uniref:Acetyltransferase n=1 Tax=Spiroplasma helicoides TaxID=216938 RepID=A0A1B3SJJ6_9MOLU|nr:DapH/DapD/GlmU-related protein [Spiroplasma helicoides]AOG60097.1 hypothetical protein SHELI_v1c01420 [Spiroplasma helicoides]
MTREEFIEYTRSNYDIIDMKNEEVAYWMNKLACEAHEILNKINNLKVLDTNKVVELFSELTSSKIDNSFRCFLPFYTDFGKNIKIGKNVFINKNCNFQDRGGICIGDNVLIGMNVNIATLNHGLEKDKRNFIYPKKVIIENNAWIGSGVTIVPGVTVGENTIIAAGAVLTKDADSNSIYAGVPAKKIKSL